MSISWWLSLASELLSIDTRLGNIDISVPNPVPVPVPACAWEFPLCLERSAPLETLLVASHHALLHPATLAQFLTRPEDP